jgi:subtilisin family serine protease
LKQRRVKTRTVPRSAARLLGLVLFALAVIGIPTALGAGDAPPGVAPDLSAPHVPNQLLVKLAPGAGALQAAGGMQVVGAIPQLGLAVVETAPGADLAAAAADLAEAPDVEWAEPNYIFRLDSVPNDPYYRTKQSVDAKGNYIDLGYPLGLMQMPSAWDYTTGRPEVVIAILDTGVDKTHPDLAGGIWTNQAEVDGDEGVDDDGNGFVDDVNGWDFADNDNLPDDDYGHGTHVAGIAAARINNGIGIAGMAGGCTIMPVDVFSGGIGTYDSLIRAIIYATDNGARVINMSLGATSYSRGEQAAVDYAWSHGVVVVASAGNNGRDISFYPAAHAHAIAVAGTTASDGWSGYNHGDYVDVAAPGTSVYSTLPGNSYGWKSGTSMAAPHVSGLAALVLSRNPDLTPDQVRGLIEQNAKDLGATGWDPYFGHGRINGFRTLSHTTPNPNPSPTPPPGPPLEIWPAGCPELIPDGNFEAGFGGWQTAGSVEITDTLAYSGALSVTFPGAPGSRGVLTRTIEMPSTPITGTLWFAYRIDREDFGFGTSSLFPFDDWLTVDLRSQDGKTVQSLLRTGNTADTSNAGLEWDQFLYRMQPVDFATLDGTSTVELVFSAGNDDDGLLTHFWVDEVRFCAAGTDNPSRPDLAALALEEVDPSCAAPAECPCGAGGGVELTVANLGLADASNFYVELATENTVGSQWRVASLPAGQSRKFVRCGNPGIYPYTGMVDRENMIVEGDETNNRISRDFRPGIYMPLVSR